MGANNTIDLSVLAWSGPNFYYKIAFTSDGTDTPVLDDIRINCSDNANLVFTIQASTGYVGIGDTTPDSALEVSSAGDDYFMISSYADGDGNILIVDSAGNMGLGVSSETAFGGGQGVFSIGESVTVPTANPVSAALFYVELGGMYVYDSSGTATLLSPHDPKTGEWIFLSKNTITGRELRVEMEQLVKYLDDTFGTDFVKEFQDGQLVEEDGTMGDGTVDGATGEQSVFVLKIKQALASLGLFVENGIAQLKEVVTDKLTAKTARIEKMEMVDAITGDIYCTWIERGEMKKVKARCDQIEYLNGQMIISGQVSEYCDYEHLNLCTSQELCEGESLFWYGGECHREMEPSSCDSDHLNLCATEADCLDVAGFWYNNSCNIESEQICEPVLEICDDQIDNDCDGKTDADDEDCQNDPPPLVCDSEHLDLCTIEADCLTAEGYWYNSICNIAPESYCGDNNLDEGEECDDGNIEDGDGCSSACQTEVSCISDWQPGDWQSGSTVETTACGTTFTQTRTYIDTNDCAIEQDKPADETQEVAGAFCQALANTDNSCQPDGTCLYTCFNGFTDSNSDMSDGCESVLVTDTSS